MAEAIPRSGDAPDPRPRDPVGRFLYAWSMLSAIGGSLVLFAICAVSVYSVVGRWLTDEPVLGDVELVQMGCALAVAAFLPWAQMKNAHVIVDFFTHSASPAVRRVLDRIAAIILMVLSFVIAWRSFAGAWEAFETGETTMLLGWPLWWSYTTLGPSFFLLGLTAAYTAWKGTLHSEGGME
ncbi:TRAP transporter small permease [Denitromonas iodatirespirans]|uniref:TRAP transporter small permease protein n=1 Tax=Denitromonas iodatirespirans TaxID=2795389 RepID=A0A944DH04_DENI1|nr:TRAP transporter small permease [Denitromonas iodatirespirans]MBT0964138.1 TRAP transporter small permease [Denitromonas iodatirespirans]